MGHYKFRNIPCSWCGENIAQAVLPPGEAMHQRCKTLSHDPIGFVSSGAGRRKRTEMVQCVWCMAWRERRAGRKEMPTCGIECRSCWKSYTAGNTTSFWPRPEQKFRSCAVAFVRCRNCSKWIVNSRGKSYVYCSRDCASATAKETGSYYAKRSPIWLMQCVDCGATCVGRSSNQKRCAPCGSLVAYRAKVFGAKASLLLPYIGKRDKWKCQICGRAVKAHKYEHMDRMSPTVDHIVPQSEARALGWSEDQMHDVSNLRLAHAKCNGDRSNRGGNEQLALVG